MKNGNDNLHQWPDEWLLGTLQTPQRLFAPNGFPHFGQNPRLSVPLLSGSS